MTASTSLTVLVTCSAAFIFLVWASAWLWGRIWFAITMASLAGVLVASEFVGIGAQSEVKRLFSLSGLALFFVMAFYFLGTRYIQPAIFAVRATHAAHGPGASHPRPDLCRIRGVGNVHR